MSTNAIFDALEDELVKSLEQGARLPPTFSITLAEVEYLALLAGGLQSNGERIAPTVTRVGLKLCGYTVEVRSSKDPEGWALAS